MENKYQLMPDLTDEEYDKLKSDIQERGVMVPIEYDESGNILDGHHRIKACKELGIKEWPRFIRKGYTEDEKRAHAIALNLARRHLSNTQRKPFWEQMREAGMTLEAIAKADGTVSKDTVKRALDTTLSNDKVDKATGKDGKKRPTKYKPRKKKTEYVSTEKSKKEENRNLRRERTIAESKRTAEERAVILFGDCMKVLSDVGTIDLLLTDPPYFTDGNFTKQVSSFLSRVKPTGQAYIFMSAEPEELAAYLAMDRHGMTLEQVLVWNYNNTGQRQPSKRYNSNFQVAFYFRGKNAPNINKPSDGTHQYACQTVNAPDGRIGDRFHKWQKPMDIVERYILNSSKPGQVVCDPFAGTGTILLAAAKHGRKAIGCDTDKAAIKIAVERGCTLK